MSTTSSPTNIANAKMDKLAAKAEKERIKANKLAEKEAAKAEKEAAKAEKEAAKAEKERVKAEKDAAKAEKERVKADKVAAKEAAKAAKEASKAAKAEKEGVKADKVAAKAEKERVKADKVAAKAEKQRVKDDNDAEKGVTDDDMQTAMDTTTLDKDAAPSLQYDNLHTDTDTDTDTSYYNPSLQNLSSIQDILPRFDISSISPIDKKFHKFAALIIHIRLLLINSSHHFDIQAFDDICNPFHFDFISFFNLIPSINHSILIHSSLHYSIDCKLHIIQGNKFLIDKTNVVYDFETHQPIGEYDPKKKEVIHEKAD